MTVEFTTSEYRFSHGKEPRGRGGWVFEVARADAVTVERFTQAARDVGMCRVEQSAGVVQVWVQMMTYGDAKRVVRDVVKAAFPNVQGPRVKVCP